MTLSIITINYNDEKGLSKTLQSVANQSCRDFEYIVIDGNSNDGSKLIIEDNSNNIKHWLSEPDTGVYNAMNKGIKIASGDYLLFLNSGDIFADNEVIAKVLPLLDNIFDIISGNLIYSLNGIPKTLFTPPEKVGLSYFLQSFLPHPSSFIKRTLFKTAGLYSEHLKIISDWEFFLKAIVIYKAKYRHINITVSNFDNSGISSNDGNKTLMEKEKEYVYEEYFPYLGDELKRLHFAGSRRMLQIENIYSNYPVLWKMLKICLNFLNLFTKEKELKFFTKIKN